MAEIAGYQESGHPTAFWPVGYPALLAASMTVFGPSLFGPILLNLAAVALKLWLILWFSRRLEPGEAIGRGAALMIIGAMPFFCTALAFGFTGQTRYHFPAIPFMCNAAAYAIARLSRARQEAQKTALAG